MVEASLTAFLQRATGLAILCLACESCWRGIFGRSHMRLDYLRHASQGQPPFPTRGLLLPTHNARYPGLAERVDLRNEEQDNV